MANLNVSRPSSSYFNPTASGSESTEPTSYSPLSASESDSSSNSLSSIASNTASEAKKAASTVGSVASSVGNAAKNDVTALGKIDPNNGTGSVGAYLAKKSGATTPKENVTSGVARPSSLTGASTDTAAEKAGEGVKVASGNDNLKKAGY